VRSEYSHPSLSAFAALAESFCACLARSDSQAPEDVIVTVHRLLPQLYLAGLQLPSTDVLFDDDVPSDEDESGDRGPLPTPKKVPPRTELPALVKLAEFLGERRFYREIFDPYSPPTETEVTGDLIDDLDDIHHDLTEGLVQWRKGHTGEALWEWRFNFEVHWSEHITSALRALYALSRDEQIPWPAAGT
jgi:Domain of unknown function (DUF5063)